MQKMNETNLKYAQIDFFKFIDIQGKELPPQIKVELSTSNINLGSLAIDFMKNNVITFKQDTKNGLTVSVEKIIQKPEIPKNKTEEKKEIKKNLKKLNKKIKK